MEIAVVGTSEFTLGFQLAGITRILNPPDDEELERDMRALLNEGEVGIVVVDSEDLLKLPERLRIQLSDSISPTFLGIGTTEDTTLRESIRKAIGVDLWK
ncbi:MAG: V-type ATP synthase subunit F [Candidatus Poseidoniales archaeon]|jgi:V/A-type H+-transporting ATPase subunit F|nr:V-type ATP synthase subunit F [Candidatus Poseidoniales archaeon]RUA02434.1 MAG: V-type ATP synthase subunit F [Candidatus Poseidoniales archaeon]